MQWENLSPSLAVQPTMCHKVGDIQLIAKPKNFDPSLDPRNAVYSADAYTRRRKIRLSRRAAEQLTKDYKDIIKKLVTMTCLSVKCFTQFAKDTILSRKSHNELERF